MLCGGGRHGVVPLPMPVMALERDRGQLLVGDLDAQWIAARVELGVDPQTRTGGGLADQLDDDLVGDQRPAAPVDRDVAEQPVVKSARGAVPVFRPVRFLGPLSRTRRASFPAPGAPRVPSGGL